MSPDEKSSLIYELIYFASNNIRILNADSPKIEIFHICKGIILGISRIVNTRQIIVQELKKHKELWNKVKPLLHNYSSKCTTVIGDSRPPVKSLELCNHYPSEHMNGKCSGNMYKLVNGNWKMVPCSCESLKSTTKW